MNGLMNDYIFTVINSWLLNVTFRDDFRLIARLHFFELKQLSGRVIYFGQCDTILQLLWIARKIANALGPLSFFLVWTWYNVHKVTCISALSISILSKPGRLALHIKHVHLTAMSLNRQGRSCLLPPLQLLFCLLQICGACRHYKLRGAIRPVLFQTDYIVLDARAIGDAKVTPMLCLRYSPIGFNRLAIALLVCCRLLLFAIWLARWADLVNAKWIFVIQGACIRI